VHLAELVRNPRIIKDPFGRGSLAGIYVRHDTDISGQF